MAWPARRKLAASTPATKEIVARGYLEGSNGAMKSVAIRVIVPAGTWQMLWEADSPTSLTLDVTMVNQRTEGGTA